MFCGISMARYALPNFSENGRNVLNIKITPVFE
jgi:hypothetical protein